MATQTQKPANGGAVLPSEQPAPELTHAIPSDGTFVVINGGELRRVPAGVMEKIAAIRVRKSSGGEAYSMEYWTVRCIEIGEEAVTRSLDYSAENKALRTLGKVLANTPEDKRGEVATQLMRELRIGGKTVLQGGLSQS